MTRATLSLFFCLLLLFPSINQAGEAQEFIEMLNQDIKLSKTDGEKSTLHIYRARQYYKIKKWEKAEADYSKALELDPKGWILLERSHFFMTRKEYSLAYDDARAAKKEVPTLSHEADKIIEVAGVEIMKQYDAENPVTIVMSGKADSSRKTRFDMMQTRRVAAAPSRKLCSVSPQKTASSKAPTKSRPKPKKKRG